MNRLIIKNASEIVTPVGSFLKLGEEMNVLRVIKDGATVIEDGVIVSIGDTPHVLSMFNENEYEVIDAKDKTVLPGFIDSHTHFIFSGFREEEFQMRLKGYSYMDIMKSGGGILNTVKATRKASIEELISLGSVRLKSMLRFGVTTVEGKSGYGLDLDTELRQLRAMKALNSKGPTHIVSTFLGAHAIE